MKPGPTLETDVLIVGAGPTGLLLANLLGRMSVNALIVERNESTVDEPRAVSIDDESMRALQAVGLDAQIARITSRGYGSIYRGPNRKPFAMVKPSQMDYGFDRRNAFQQPEFERLLREAFVHLPSLTSLFGTEIVSFSQSRDAVMAKAAKADGSVVTISARYMIACDGGRSGTRKSLNIAMEGSTFEEPWLIVDLLSTKNRSFHTEVFCDPARSCITLPGPGGIRRYEFKLNPGETTEMAEREDFARSLLASVGPDANEPLRRVRVYTFHARSATRWRDRRIFLAGDAAHLTPPFAGQGMNSGLRDAHNLAWKLHEALDSGDPEPLLASYEVERKPHAWAMIELAMRMGQVMMPSSHLIGALIRGGFRLASHYPPAHDYFTQMKYKPKPRFSKGLLWPDGLRERDTVVGRMLPQPLVDTVSRERVLLDALLPDRPVALIFDEQPEVAVPPDVRSRLAEIGAVAFGLTPEWMNPVADTFPIVRDYSRLFSQAPFSSYLGHVLLLRRDRYVAASCPAKHALSLVSMIRQITANQVAATVLADDKNARLSERASGG